MKKGARSLDRHELHEYHLSMEQSKSSLSTKFDSFCNWQQLETSTKLNVLCLLMVCISQPMTVRNITTDYQNCSDIVSPDDMPPPPTALLSRNHVDRADSGPVTPAAHQQNTSPPSLPTSPVHVPTSATNLSSPTNSCDSAALGKVCISTFVRLRIFCDSSWNNLSCCGTLTVATGLDIFFC